MSDMIERAVRVAYAAHRGQSRRDGKTPYITHVAGVTAKCSIFYSGAKSKTERKMREEFIASAWLHDVVEDTDVTLEEIRKEFGDIVAGNVDVLTKKNDEDYMEYVIKAAQGNQTRIIKLMDILDNLSDSPTVAQSVRYMQALEILA